MCAPTVIMKVSIVESANRGPYTKKREFYVIIERTEDGCFLVEVPRLRGFHSYWDTLDEFMTNIREVILLCLDDLPEYGDSEYSTEIAGIQRIEMEALRRMPLLPVLRASEVITALEQPRFERVWQRGSHVTMRHPCGRTTVLPYDGPRDVHPNMTHKI